MTPTFAEAVALYLSRRWPDEIGKVIRDHLDRCKTSGREPDREAIERVIRELEERER